MTQPGPILAVLERVRCLECGAVYSKPTGGGTVRQNPGCPECGYVGWIIAEAPPAEDARPSRFGGGQQPHRAY